MDLGQFVVPYLPTKLITYMDMKLTPLNTAKVKVYNNVWKYCDNPITFGVISPEFNYVSWILVCTSKIVLSLYQRGRHLEIIPCTLEWCVCKFFMYPMHCSLGMKFMFQHCNNSQIH